MFLDDEKPRVVSCPTDKIIQTSEDKVAVSWEPVIFKDNAGDDKLMIIPPGQTNNSEFYKGGIYPILYTATDGKNPSVECFFTITVTCKY